MRITDKMLYQHAGQARELWLRTLPQRDEVPEPSVSAAFEQSMDALLCRQRRAERRQKGFITARRIAVVLLIAASVTFAGLMTVEAFREKVIRVITEVYREFTQYNYSGAREDVTLPEINLNSLPAGMEVLSDETTFGRTRRIHCENGFGQFLDLEIDVFSNHSAGTQRIDTEDADIITKIIHEKEVTVISKKDWHVLQWEESGAVFMIFSNLDLAALEQLAANVCAVP